MNQVLRCEDMICHNCGHEEKDVLIERYLDDEGNGNGYEEVLCPNCMNMMQRNIQRPHPKHSSWKDWNTSRMVG